MNDFVLRGFCKTCSSFIVFHKKSFLYPYNVKMEHVCLNTINKKCKPVWSLSANQMRIIESSKKFIEWANKRYPTMILNNEDRVIYLIRALESESFLVARILKEARERKEEMNRK